MTTLQQSWTEWVRGRRQGWTPKVADYVTGFVNGWCMESLKGGPISGVVDRICTKRSRGGRSASALNQERMYLRMWARWARQMGHIVGQPEDVWRRRQEWVKKEYIVLTQDEEARLIAECRGELKLFVEMAIRTGLRMGTLMRTKWEMIGPDGFMSIPAEISKTRKLLRVCWNNRYATWLPVPESMKGKIFSSFTTGKLYRDFKAAVVRSGIRPETGIHDLRRTWVARMFQAGARVDQVQKIGGWRSLGTLLKHYTALPTDTETRELVEKASNL